MRPILDEVKKGIVKGLTDSLIEPKNADESKKNDGKRKHFSAGERYKNLTKKRYL